MIGRRATHAGLAGAILAIAALALAAGSSPAAAGGTTLGDDEMQSLPSYYGFVRDTAGHFLSGVKITVKVKGISVVAHTDELGSYEIPVISTDDTGAELSCSKDGYRQTNALRRTPLGADATTPVEIDCTLERQ